MRRRRGEVQQQQEKEKEEEEEEAAMDWEALRDQILQSLAVVAIAAVVASLGITLVESYKRRSLPFCAHSAIAETFIPHLHLHLPHHHHHEYHHHHHHQQQQQQQKQQQQQLGACQSCPENGICYGGELQCLPGFNKHGRVCLRDQQAHKAVKAVENYVMQHVCGHFTFPLCQWTGLDWVPEDEEVLLVENSGIDKRLMIDPSKFRLAIEEGVKAAKKQLIERRISDGLLELQCPIELREHYKSYFCCLQQWIFYNYVILLVTASSVFLIAKILSQLYHKHKLSIRAEELYLQVCETLEEKAHRKSSGGETWVVTSHLRDHLLTPQERQNKSAWSMVEHMVNRDSRIDQYPKLVKGESKVVWEWQVESRLTTKQSQM